MRKLIVILLTILLSIFIVARTKPANPSLVLIHITVIGMTGAPAKPDMTVVITGNRIAGLGRSGEVAVPQDSRIVDGKGKFLIPGLWDMHVHTVYDSASDTETTFLPLLVANGITGIRNPGSIFSIEQINQWRKRAAEGGLLAPRIIVGQQIDGP